MQNLGRAINLMKNNQVYCCYFCCCCEPPHNVYVHYGIQNAINLLN